MLRKIGEWKAPDVCTDQGHIPPAYIYLTPGIYEHTCPNCGKRTVFIVPQITC